MLYWHKHGDGWKTPVPMEEDPLLVVVDPEVKAHFQAEAACHPERETLCE